VGPYHHGLPLPRVAEEGDGLQIRKAAADVLNEQSRTADKEWSPSLGVGREAVKKNTSTLRTVTRGVGSGQILSNDLSNDKLKFCVGVRCGLSPLRNGLRRGCFIIGY